MDEPVVNIESGLQAIVEESTPKRPIPKADRLSEREVKFIEFYVESLNSLESYKKAFPTRGMLPEEIQIEAQKLLSRNDIERRLRPMLAKKLDSHVIAAPHALMKYINEIMSLDPSDFYDEFGTAKPLNEIPFEKRKFLRVGKPTVNNKTGARYVSYEIPNIMVALDKLFEVVKLVTTVKANSGGDEDASIEAQERRARILNSLE